MPVQGLVMSVPPGVTVIRQKDELLVAFKYHKVYSVVPSALHVSMLAVPCPVFGRALTGRGRAGAGAERCRRLNSSGQGTAATSICDSVLDIPVPGSAALAGAGMTQDLRDAHSPPLVFSPPPAHPAVHVELRRCQAPASCYWPPFKPIS